jgi:NADP-dependent 3-hydroxy acid dehydrogenase YdfG
MGAKIATCARNQDKLYDLQLRHSKEPLHCIVADVSNYNDCKLLLILPFKQFGGIDILINNAGISMRALLKDAELDVFKKVMDINFFGTVVLYQTGTRFYH